MKKYINGTVLFGNKLSHVDLVTDNNTILTVGNDIGYNDIEVVDCTNKFILPALIDIHTHGCMGFDFNTATLEQMHTMMNFYVSRGVGSVLPTLVADDVDVLCSQLSKIALLSKTYSEVLGVNLECFISANKCGAIDPSKVLPCDSELFVKLYKASNGLIRLVTVSPEVEGAIDFIKQLSSAGIAVSLGHSTASTEVTEKAISAGAKAFTHTFNAMMLPSQRHANIGGVALVSDSYCEMIMDKLHLDNHIANIIYRCKSVDKVIAVTDSMSATGLGDGNYMLGTTRVTVEHGVALVEGTETLAGSTLTADNCLTNVMQVLNLPIDKAILTMTANPAKMLGVFDKVGSIDVGKQANLLIIG